MSDIEKQICGLKRSVDKYKRQNNLVRKFIFKSLFCEKEGLRTKREYLVKRLKRKNMTEIDKAVLKTRIECIDEQYENLNSLYNIFVTIFE